MRCFTRLLNIFFQVVVLLDKCGSRLTNFTDLEDVETLKKIFNEDLAGYNEVYDVIDDFKMVEKYGGYGRKKNVCIIKIIGFPYTHIMDFKKI